MYNNSKNSIHKYLDINSNEVPSFILLHVILLLNYLYWKKSTYTELWTLLILNRTCYVCENGKIHVEWYDMPFIIK